MKSIKRIRIIILILFVACFYFLGYYLSKEYVWSKQNITDGIDNMFFKSIVLELERRVPDAYFPRVKPHLDKNLLDYYQTITKDRIIDVIYIDSLLSASLNNELIPLETAITVKYLETENLLSSSIDDSFYKTADYISTLVVGKHAEIKINAYVSFPSGYIFKNMYFLNISVIFLLSALFILFVLFAGTFIFNKGRKSSDAVNDINKDSEREFISQVENSPEIESATIPNINPVIDILDLDKPIRKLNDGNYVLGELLLNSSKRCFCRGTEEIKLKRQEFDILRIFIEQGNKDFFVTRDVFKEKLWDDSFNGEDNLNTAIKRLRRKLTKIKSNLEIITKRNFGYRLYYNHPQVNDTNDSEKNVLLN